MNILIPVVFFGKGGGFRVLSNLATNWINLGHRVDFVTTTEDKPYYPTNANIYVINTKGKKTTEHIKLRSIFLRLFSLYLFMKNYAKQYDVFLANFNQTAPLAFFANRSKTFYYVQAYEVEFWNKSNLHNRLCRLFAKLTYYLPIIKIGNANIYRNYQNLRCKYIIPPGLDLSVYYPKKNDTWNDSRPLVIGCIGRKEIWKGTEDVTKAIEILRSKNIKIQFKVAFNPVNLEDYELVYPDGDENLANFYRSLDILIAPGRIQLGAVHYPVIEAMACKTIVINTGYYPSTIENSYIVPVASPMTIAKTVCEIMQNYENAITKAECALKYLDNFTWNKVSTQFIDVFSKELYSMRIK